MLLILWQYGQHYASDEDDDANETTDTCIRAAAQAFTGSNVINPMYCSKKGLFSRITHHYFNKVFCPYVSYLLQLKKELIDNLVIKLLL